MKRIYLSLVALLIPFIALLAQIEEGLPALDKSPMDMSYFPNNYPILRSRIKLLSRWKLE